MVNTILKEADLFCPNSVRINFTIYHLEDEFGQHTVLIPYGTMLKENSRKWQSDDRKVMNWDYHEKD
ncbi:hypothetical protein ACE5SX_18325, partial [Lactiplantibacillus plantarum]|uniref:hypothetical protein n=1 Tax=Lactiplantibacillus plantarum TaxID=1590 RepID=UPI003C2521BC